MKSIKQIVRKMLKEEYILEINHKNSEIKAIQSEIEILENKYIKQYGEYQVGDKITANINNWESKLHHFECKKVVVKKDGSMDYKFKEIGRTLTTYDLKHLYNVKQEIIE